MQKITWTLEALNDFEDYIDWYLQSANEVIAGRFIEAVAKALDSIKDNNYITRMVDEIPELREYVVQQFPFLISYWIKDRTEIVITSFLHQKKKK
jgi:plasmid stabilization system protein ParE